MFAVVLRAVFFVSQTENQMTKMSDGHASVTLWGFAYLPFAYNRLENTCKGCSLIARIAFSDGAFYHSFIVP